MKIYKFVDDTMDATKLAMDYVCLYVFVYIHMYDVMCTLIDRHTYTVHCICYYYPITVE